MKAGLLYAQPILYKKQEEWVIWVLHSTLRKKIKGKEHYQWLL